MIWWRERKGEGLATAVFTNKLRRIERIGFPQLRAFYFLDLVKPNH